MCRCDLERERDTKGRENWLRQQNINGKSYLVLLFLENPFSKGKSIRVYYRVRKDFSDLLIVVVR